MASERNKVLSITMRVKDRMTRALVAARVGLAALKRVGGAAFRALAVGARLVGTAIRTMLGPIGLLLTALSGFAIVRFIKDTATMGDELAKLSRRVGVGVEALSRLKFIMELSGGTMGDLDALLRRSAKSITDAEQGLTTATRALDVMGVSLDELKGKTPEQQFMRLLEGLASIDDVTRRAGVAMQFFGRQGSKLLPVLDTIRQDGIEALTKEAERLGIVIDQDMAQKSERFVDAMLRLKSAFIGIRNTLVEELLPVFAQWAEDTAVWLSEHRESLEKTSVAWAVTARKIKATLAFVVGTVRAGVTLIRDLLADPAQAESFGFVMRQVADLALDIARETVVALWRIVVNSVQIATAPLVEAVKLLGEVAGQGLVGAVLDEIRTIPARMGQTITEAYRELGTAGLVLALPGMPLHGMADFLNTDWAAAVDKARDKTKTAREALEAYGRALEAFTGTKGPDFAAMLGGSVDEIQSVEEAIGRLGQNVVTSITEDLSDVGDAVGNLVEGVGTAWDEFFTALKGEGEKSQAVADFTARVDDLRAAWEAARLAAEATGTKAAEAAGKAVAELAKVKGAIAAGTAPADAGGATDGPTQAGTFWEGMESQVNHFVDTVGDRFAEGAKFASAFGDTLQDGLGNVLGALVDKTTSLKDAFRDMGAAALRIIGQVVARFLSAQLLGAFGFTGAGAAAAGGIVQGGGSTPILGFASGGLTPGKGGVVGRPTLFFAGEGRKREAIIPLPDGRHVPAVVKDESPRAGDVNVTFDIRAFDSRDVKRVLVDEADTITAVIKRAIQQQNDMKSVIRSA